MKQETKELVRWIKNHIFVANNKGAELYLHKAFDFLDSIPEIELRLCLGGYIQDRNGTPCCHGDKVMLVENKHIGVLTWEPDKARFYLTFTYEITNSKAVQQIAVYKNEIEKVEE